jgi:hypothetical protein
MNPPFGDLICDYMRFCPKKWVKLVAYRELVGFLRRSPASNGCIAGGQSPLDVDILA